MDNKVKITLITTGALLLLIISTGLYYTVNSKSSPLADIKQAVNQRQINVSSRKVALGSRSKVQIKTNDYYFPKKKTVREKVDPMGNLIAEELEEDDFFKPNIPKPFDMTAEFDDDYVQAPEVDTSMNLPEADNPDPEEIDNSEQIADADF